MDKKSKSILAIIAIIMLIIIAIVCFNKISKKEEKQPTNADVSQTVQQEDKISELKKIEDYEIFNADISVASGITSFKAYIRNTSNETKQDKNFDIQILGENEEILATVTVHIENLEPSGIKQVSGEIWKGIQNAKDYRVIEK